MREAAFYQVLPDNRVLCYLCAQKCKISEDRVGICGVRINQAGKLYTLVYGLAVAANIDPIEKKSFFHMLPGSRSMSIATAGCNFRCQYCQNWEISQISKGEHKQISGEELSPERVVQLAKRYNCKTISYTYTEPTIFYEYALETAKLAKQEGIYNIFVTNGYITEEPLREIKPYLAACNVDLKSFDDKKYRRIMGAVLQPVLDSLKLMKELGIWVEVTTLLIPTVNDSLEELKDIANFVKSLGPETPWHVTAFHPDYKMLNLPATPSETLKKARKIGLEAGLRYVYSGNIPGLEGENTYCYNCGKLLLKRVGFQVLENQIENGACPYCKKQIDGIWN